MKLSSKSRYGLKACLELAQKYEQNAPVPLPEFSLQVGVTEAYMEQIMILLRKADIVGSARGVTGGYFLSRSPENITVGEVLRALEDGLEFIDCLKQPCGEFASCKTRGVWEKIFDTINDVLDSMTLADLSNDGTKEVCGERIYLDHAATTPLDSAVLKEMLPYLTSVYGNANSTHAYGRKAASALDLARRRAAEAVGAAVSEIYFTAGGSEGDNWALRGVFDELKNKGKSHIVTTRIEHTAVFNLCKKLEQEGARVTYLPVDENGLVDADELESAVTPDTAIVSVMTANNEIGVVQPIESLCEIAHAKGALFHTDAVQAVGAVDVNVKRTNVDLLTLSAHKFYGPKGAGALYIKKGVRIAPLIAGGEQENGLRGGTSDTAAFAGLGAAIKKAADNLEANSRYTESLRDAFENRVLAALDDIKINGINALRLPSISSITFKGTDGASIVQNLDLKGICASEGSACSAGAVEPSRVILAIGGSEADARSTVRFSFGKDNTLADAQKAADVLIAVVNKLRDVKSLFKADENPAVDK